MRGIGQPLAYRHEQPQALQVERRLWRWTPSRREVAAAGAAKAVKEVKGKEALPGAKPVAEKEAVAKETTATVAKAAKPVAKVRRRRRVNVGFAERRGT